MASSLDARSGSLDAALRKLGDGLSVLERADSSLANIGNMLDRMRELAVQSASEVLADDERAYVAREFDAIKTEITRTARDAHWGDHSLLSPTAIDIGLVVDSSASMGNEINQTRLAIGSFMSDLAANGLDAALGLAKMTRVTDTTDNTTRLVDLGSAGLQTTLANMTLDLTAVDPWAALANTAGTEKTPGVTEPDRFGWREHARDKLLIVISDTGREVDLIPGAESQASVAAALAAEGFEVHAIVPPGRFGDFSTLTSATGGSLHAIGASGSGVSGALTSIAASLPTGTSPPIQLQAGPGASDDHRIALPHPVDATAGGLGLTNTSVTTAGDAQTALDDLDAAIRSVSSMRAQNGASANRLRSARRYVTTERIQTEAARSRIEDADLADAASVMAKMEALAEVQIRAVMERRRAAQAYARLIDQAA